MAAIRVLQVFIAMNRGGSESMIMNYYRQIDKNKVQFDFLVHRNEKADFNDEIEKLGGKIYKLNPINILNPTPYYNQLRVFFKSHNQYHIIHSHLNTFSSYPLKIAKEFNIPCRIAHAHIAMDKLTLKTIIKNKEGLTEVAKKLIKLFLKKRITKYPTHYFSCGQKAGKWLFGNMPFNIINNAINSKKFEYNSAIAKHYKKKLDIKDNMVLGHIGRFDSQKNHSFLLKVFAELIKKHSKCKLLLIGDGPLKKQIEEEIKALSIDNKVMILGVRDDIPELLQVMDFFVFPSIYEGLPVTLIEAQASGTYVLAANTISEEVKITNNFNFMSLNELPEFWAEKILQIKKENPIKKSTKYLIVKNGYDIISNSIKLKEFYLNQKAN